MTSTSTIARTSAQDDASPAGERAGQRLAPFFTDARIRASAAEVEFADADGSGVRSNALEFSRASRMVRACAVPHGHAHAALVLAAVWLKLLSQTRQRRIASAAACTAA
jgi:hypothetical protein